MQDPTYKIFLCDYINPQTEKKATLVRNGAIVLKKQNRPKNQCLYKIYEKGEEKSILPKYFNKQSVEVIQMTKLLALPAFFDMHFHWVQDGVCLKPKISLLDWLKKYTWPYEAKFKNKKFSSHKAYEFSKLLTKVGTLGGACYSSIHSNALEDAFKNFLGDFLIGNVIMTINSPKYLCMKSGETATLIRKMITKYQGRYALTPRFALSVDAPLMRELGDYIKKKKIFVQTHLSETKVEIKAVLDLYKEFMGFEKVKTYTEIYDKCKLIGPRSLFGHGIYLSSKELSILKKKKAWIAHCPTSNAPIKDKGLGSGLFDFKKIESAGVNWVLASDVGGGPYLSMFDVIESFVSQNKKKLISSATYTKGLFHSTLKSAEFLGLKKTHGNLDRGKYANMIFVESPSVRDNEKSEEVLKKIISKNKLNRKKYNEMVYYTYYKGHEVYNSRSR